jgi:hypothetical protein
MTITLDELRKKYEELGKMIKSFEEQQKEAEFPKEGDTYYLINSNGSIHLETYELAYDEEVYSIGNCFRTKEEAEFAVEQRKVIAEMKRCDGVWKVKRDSEGEYCLRFSYARTIVKDVSFSYAEYPEMWFPTEEAAQKAIDTIGEERLLKYWFCVEV